MLTKLSASPAYGVVAAVQIGFDEPVFVGDHPLTATCPCYVAELGIQGIRILRVRPGHIRDIVSLHLWSFRPEVWKVLIVRSDRTTTGLCVTECYDHANPLERSLVFRTGLRFTADCWALCRTRNWTFRYQGINFDRP